MTIPTIAIVFDNKVRPDTTGTYCRRALEDLACVHHYLPSEFDRLPRAGFDLYLFIDDGLDYAIPDDIHPSAFWAIDTHLDFDRVLRRARNATHVFAAQRDGAKRLRNAGIANTIWLPLAADPEIHRPHPVEKAFDVCFVGHPFDGPRNDLVRHIQQHFPNSFVGQRFFDDMAMTYSASRIVFNRSLKNDVNMRVFEALACGSMLVTNDLGDNGQGELFQDGVHFATYRDAEDLINTIQFYLDHDEERGRIAFQGRHAVVSAHTYHHRIQRILESVFRADDGVSVLSSPSPNLEPIETPREVLSPTAKNLEAISDTNAQNDVRRTSLLTSIIIVAHNELSYTRLCLESLCERTTEPYELIFVDNGSTDGTIEYVRTIPGVQVIANPNNRGFPAAVNQAIKLARGAAILLLNNDTIVTTGWLGRMLSLLDSDPRIGIVGPCSNRVSGIQQVPVTYTNLEQVQEFAQSWGRIHDYQAVPTDRLVGFCLLIRREVVERIGLLDEQFGIGNFEDDDYCRRAIQAGYLLRIAASAFVHHFGSRTFIGTGADFQSILLENERKFESKWNPTKTDEPALTGRAPARTPRVDSSFPSSALNSHNPYRLHKDVSNGLFLEKKPIRLSLCMIVRNNETTIRPCLESIRPWVDEMTVVDTGSTDATAQICEELGAKVFHWAWRDHFSAARNQSFDHATGDWLFWMDSDDTIPAECGQKLRALADAQHSPETFGYVIQVHCPGRHQENPLDVTAVDHVKLVRNDPDLRFEFRIHEQILPAIRRKGGDVKFTDIYVVHSGSDHTAEGRVRKLERDFKLLQLDLQEHPGHPFVLFNLGMTHADAGDHQEAAKWLNRCLEVSSPDESHVRKAYALLLSCLMQLKNHSQAKAICTFGRRLFPGDKELLFRQAMLCAEIGELEEAVTLYLEVLAPTSERHFASIDLGLSGYKARQNLALVYETQGRFDLAENEWRTIIADQPDYVPAQIGLIECLIQSGNDLEAGNRIEKLRLMPGMNAEATRLAACRIASTNGIGAAICELEYGLRVHHDDIGLLRDLARLQHASRNYAQALSTLERLTRIAPDDSSAWHNCGVVLGCLDRHNEAQQAIARAESLRSHKSHQPSII